MDVDEADKRVAEHQVEAWDSVRKLGWWEWDWQSYHLQHHTASWEAVACSSVSVEQELDTHSSSSLASLIVVEWQQQLALQRDRVEQVLASIRSVVVSLHVAEQQLKQHLAVAAVGVRMSHQCQRVSSCSLTQYLYHTLVCYVEGMMLGRSNAMRTRAALECCLMHVEMRAGGHSSLESHWQQEQV